MSTEGWSERVVQHALHFGAGAGADPSSHFGCCQLVDVHDVAYLEPLRQRSERRDVDGLRDRPAPITPTPSGQVMEG